MLETNEYFDGKVKSIGFKTTTLPATVGVMAIGEYAFSTSEKETMTVVSGELVVQLPQSEEWTRYTQHESFVVEASQTFHLKVSTETAYLCIYG